MKILIQSMLIGCFLALTATTINAQTLEDKIVVGLWDTDDGDNTKVQMYKGEDGKWIGEIVSTDVRRSIGKLLFVEGVYDSEEDEIVGTIIIPGKEWRISTTLSIETPDVLTLVGRKYLLSKTFYWKKDK